VALSVLVYGAVYSNLQAHEGHEPIPSKGALINAERGTIALSANAVRMLDVRTGEVITQRHQDRVRTFATIESPWGRRAVAASILPGRVSAIHVRSGVRVKAGQLLAEIESRELELLHREHVDAVRELKGTKNILELLSPTRRTGAVPELRIFEADNAVRLAQNRLWVLQTKANVLDLPWRGESHIDSPEAGREHWGNLHVRSPIDGTVLQQDVILGQSVTPDMHLFQIVDNDSLWIRLHVLEKDASKLSVGLPVEFTLNAFPERVWRTSIDTISRGIAAETQQVSAWCTLSVGEMNAEIQPGMSGQAVFYRGADQSKLSVPRSALWSDGLSHYVFVETASTRQGAEYEKRLVWVDTDRYAEPSLGAVGTDQRTDSVELMAGGLFSSDRVVVQGAHELAGLMTRSSLRLDSDSAARFGIEFATAEVHPLAKTLSIDIEVELSPTKRFRIAPQLPGVLKKIHVDRSQAVRTGEILAELSSLEVVDMQLDWIQSLLDHDMQIEMQQRLTSATGSVSPRTLLDLQLSIEKNQTLAASLQHQLQLVGFDEAMLRKIAEEKMVFDAFPLRAPSDSIVFDFIGKTGDTITLGEDIFELHDPSGFQVIGFVPAKDSELLSVGQTVRTRFDAFPDRVFSGRVSRISPTVSRETGALSIWIELDGDHSSEFRDRMLGRAAISIGSLPNALCVPRSSVIRDGSSAFVFVRDPDGSVERRQVTIGPGDDKLISIVAGVNPGEQVAVTQVMGLQTAYASIR
jgi:RND family efflux transporter MFP subunit